jgi:hypothetical protein
VAELDKEFGRQARHLDDRSWVLICHRQGRPVGFTLFNRREDTLYDGAAGFDYQEVGGTAA